MAVWKMWSRFSVKHSAHDQLLHIDVGADKGRELRWQFANVSRLDATVPDKTWHFCRAGFKQESDAAVVALVAINDRRFAPSRIELKIEDAYSWEGLTSTGSFFSALLSCLQRAICSTQSLGYSSSGMCQIFR